MPPLRIIYTPYADKFRLNSISSIFSKYRGDPETNAMREAYATLRERVPDLPEIVGVASLDEIMKRYEFRMRKEMETDGIVPMTTTYFPLDILDAAIKLRDEDSSTPLGAEYVIRTLMVLLAHPSMIPSMIGNQDRPGWVTEALLVGSSIPRMNQCAQLLQNLMDRMRETGEDDMLELEPRLKDDVVFLREMGDWGKIERVRDWFYERFGANRVSRGFPLIFMKPALEMLELASVKLDDRYEERTWPEGLEGILRKVASTEDDAGKLLAELKCPAKDFFGRTERFVLIEELLGSLPEPKTLITDLYIVDHFPDLTKMGFEPLEYMPPGLVASEWARNEP